MRRHLSGVLALALTGCLGSLVAFPPRDAGASTCAQGLTACDAGCASLPDDPHNCGACGHPCALDEACAAGACYRPTCTTTACTATQVCLDEHCRERACLGVTCPDGQTCFQGTCWNAACATHACAAGRVCLVDACAEPDCIGVACGESQVCRDGQCLDVCLTGGACVPPQSPCHLGAASCSDAGVRTCVDQGVDTPLGTPCGDAGVCRAGACVACAAGAGCTSASDPCHLGTVSCSTGAPVCQGSASPVPSGTSCGVDQVCADGTCLSCREDAGCQPVDPCHLGVLRCGGATGPTCLDVGGLQPAGTSCGTDQVCAADAGCVACRAGVTCAPSDPCRYGVISCASGEPTCTATTVRPTGTRCDGGSCDPSGACLK